MRKLVNTCHIPHAAVNTGVKEKNKFDQHKEESYNGDDREIFGDEVSPVKANRESQQGGNQKYDKIEQSEMTILK
ncbi:MAG: hypothetical protein GX452_14155 [Ignavibacteriales bacterium]|jgi:hypothetical protein|nr:hypothetical protein [Ignavibacteriaceae bacterium]NLH62538.1 hypothetical protein [Ignavibacteriales bacterium]HPO56093.1 hypothetical protein [Ignavibacteriaceae bacterium]